MPLSLDKAPILSYNIVHSKKDFVLNMKTLKQEIVTKTVREWIQSGKYAPGDKLPTSEELAELFSINKRTVASGLAPLVKERLLERKTYRGTVVRNQDRSASSGNEVALLTVGQSRAYGDLAKEVNQLLKPYGMYPVIINEAFINNTEEIHSFLMRLTERKCCAGLLIEGSTNVPYDLLRKYPARFPRQVYIFRYHAAEEIPGAGYVLIDMEDIARQTVEYFAERNAKRIFFPAHFEKNYTGIHSSMQEQVMRGILKYAPEHGISIDWEVFWALHRGTLSKEDAFRALFTGKNPPDAVFGWGDEYTLKTIFPLLDKYAPDWRGRIRLISVFNTCNSTEAGFPSFDFRSAEVAKMATEMLIGKRKREKIILPAKLEIRPEPLL